jgi:hypothetical protein
MDPGSSGDERVDAVLAALGALPETPVAGHVEVFERVHRGLQEILTGAADAPEAPHAAGGRGGAAG